MRLFLIFVRAKQTPPNHIDSLIAVYYLLLIYPDVMKMLRRLLPTYSLQRVQMDTTMRPQTPHLIFNQSIDTDESNADRKDKENPNVHLNLRLYIQA